MPHRPTRNGFGVPGDDDGGIHPPLRAAARRGIEWRRRRKELHTSESGIETRAADGRRVLPWSVDYMTGNPETVPVKSAPVKAAKRREVWISGTAAEAARRGLEAGGFAVLEKRPLE